MLITSIVSNYRHRASDQVLTMLEIQLHRLFLYLAHAEDNHQSNTIHNQYPRIETFFTRDH